MTEYLLKFVSSDGKIIHKVVDENVDIFGFYKIRIGGILYDPTNIGTVSGLSILEDYVDSVCGASSLRDDQQDLLLQSVSGSLEDYIDSVCGASSIRDDQQDLLLQSVSSAIIGYVNSEITEISGASSIRDDSLQVQIDVINNTYPQEEYYLCVSAGHRIYTVSGFSFHASTAIKDIQVFRNLGRLKSPKDYVKLSTTSIELTFDPVIDDEILIDLRR